MVDSMEKHSRLVSSNHKNLLFVDSNGHENAGLRW